MPSAINETDSPLVRAFHQILIWPLHLVSSKDRADGRNPWDILRNDPAQIWKEVDDEFGTDLDSFSERHYREFVTFLPYVQRLFYGVGLRRSGGSDGESLIKVYRRSDIAKARGVFSGRREPVTVDMRHIDLYFFHDLDLAILVVEVCGADMPLGAVQNMLHSFGRAYPAGWDSNGHGLSCPRKTEWLAADGRRQVGRRLGEQRPRRGRNLGEEQNPVRRQLRLGRLGAHGAHARHRRSRRDEHHAGVGRGTRA